jgi:excisionase family DNA binding protein
MAASNEDGPSESKAEILTVSDAAKELGVSLKTLGRIVRTGGIKEYRVKLHRHERK